MGIIARQGFKRSIISAIGVVIGAFSVLFIYPLAKDAYGYIQFLFSYSTILALILGFGSTGLVVRFYPELKKKYGESFLTIIASVTVLTILVLSGILFLSKHYFYQLLEAANINTNVFERNFSFVYTLAILYIFIQILILHASNFKRIVIPAIIHELAFKVLSPILVLLYYYGKIELVHIPYVLIGFYILSMILNSLYLKSIGGLNTGRKNFFSLPAAKRTELLKYMSFSGLNSISSNITIRVDTLMIPAMLSMTLNGIYAIFMFISNVVNIPVVSINQIASPVISQSIKDGDFENVNTIYKKSSINSFIAGAIIFIVIWALMPDIIAIMPKGEKLSPYIYVFFWLGIARLIDMLTSINTYIIIYSKYYKFNLVFLTVLAVVNIILNYFLISKYGITGAAMATAISMALYNILKLYYIKIKFGLHPFSKSTIFIIIIAAIVFITGSLLPSTGSVILNIVYKPLVLTTVYYLLIKIFKIKADIVMQAERLIVKIKR